MNRIGSDIEKSSLRGISKKDHWVYGVCGLCYCECAICTRVVDGKPVAIEGVPESDKGPKGGSCARGVTSIMDYYDPNRILYPVKRTNPKKGLHEDPRWERISWEEALDTISEKLIETRKRNPRGFIWAHTPGPTGSSGCSGGFTCLWRHTAAIVGRPVDQVSYVAPLPITLRY